MDPIFRAKENPDFVVDRNRSTLLNTNKGKLSVYKRERQRIQESRLNTDRIDKLEQDLSEIKQLLRDLINGNK